MSIKTPFGSYNDYLNSVEEFNRVSMFFAQTVVGATLITSLYTFTQGILPFFTDTIDPTK